jgi:hypothetical protein
VRKLFVVAIITTLATVSGSLPATAIFEGREATGSPYILTLLTNKSVRASFCSMALLTERIVVTAAHCVIADQGKAPDLRWDIKDIYVSQPGADVTRDDVASRVHVAQVVTVPDFINTWKPEIRDYRTQINDIAFLFLDSPLVKGYSIEIASEEEIKAAYSSNQKVTHYGYGLQSPTTQNHAPWTMQLPLVTNFDEHLDPAKVMYVQEGPSALCPGDSGGPWYLEVNGVKKIAAVTVAASGCRGNMPYNGKALGTRIYPYIQMMNAKWDEFLASEKQIKEAAATKVLEDQRLLDTAKANGTYLTPGGCHAYNINAELQYLNSDDKWSVAAPAMGWVASADGCPKTHPTMPWTTVPFSEKSQLRWRFWSTSFDVLGDPFIWQPPVKSSPIPSPTSVASKPVIAENTTKAQTYKCKKKQIIKTFKGLSKKCPKGWTISR